MDKNPAVVNQISRYFDAEKPTNKSHLPELIIKSRLQQAKLLLGIPASLASSSSSTGAGG